MKKPKLRARLYRWLLSFSWLCYLTHCYATPKPPAPTVVVPQVTLSQIQSAYGDKQYQQVLVLTTRRLQQYPNDPDAYLFQGYAYYQLHNNSAAEEDFKQVLQIDNTYPDAWLAWAQIYSANTQYQQALTIINQGLTHLPNDLSLLTQKAIIIAHMSLQASPSLSTPIPFINHVMASATEESTPQVTTAANPTTATQAKTTNTPAKPLISLESIKALRAANKIEEAKADAITYLKQYPKDADVRSLLGSMYQSEQNWALAEQQYELVLADYPTYPDIRMSLINILLQQKDYIQAMNTALTGLQYPGDHSDLHYAIATIDYAQKNYPDALHELSIIPDYQQDTRANALYQAINEDTNYRYESYVKVGTNTSIIPVKNPNQVWSLSSVYAEYDTPKGLIGVQLYYQTRPGDLRAQQYVLYAQPWLTKTNYITLNYATAHQPDLFPNQLIYAEDYQLLPHGFGISAGDTYRKLPLNYFNSYTGSIYKYIGNYYVALRPTYYVPNQGPRSLLWTGTAQKYFTAVDYLGISLSDGTSPDLADLNTANFLRTQVKVYMLNGQYGFTPQVAMQYGIGQMLENFGNDNLRHYTYLNLGLSFRDV